MIQYRLKVERDVKACSSLFKIVIPPESMLNVNDRFILSLLSSGKLIYAPYLRTYCIQKVNNWDDIDL